MPSLEHEFPLDLIRHSPDLAAELLGHAAGASPPDYTRARCDAGEATTTAPPELRADSVVVLERCEGHDEHTAVQAIIVECQNSRDTRKRYSWPLYVASVRARLRCPVVLLVLTATERLARWCARPIDLGGGHLVHRPVTLALAALPPITDPQQAQRHPYLAVLTAAIHHATEPAVLKALVPAFHSLDQADSSLYADYVLAALPLAARKYLEEQMTLADYEFKTDFIGRPFRAGEAKGRAEGLTEGRAANLLTILEARALPVSEAVRERVGSCEDVDQLDRWVRKAITATRAEDIFE